MDEASKPRLSKVRYSEPGDVRDAIARFVCLHTTQATARKLTDCVTRQILAPTLRRQVLPVHRCHPPTRSITAFLDLSQVPAAVSLWSQLARARVVDFSSCQTQTQT
jgi:hypothetical protein